MTNTEPTQQVTDPATHHADRARGWMASITPGVDYPEDFALAEATLALAEEQRTANLIAHLRAERTHWSVADRYRLNNLIDSRLGIKRTEDKF